MNNSINVSVLEKDAVASTNNDKEALMQRIDAEYKSILEEINLKIDNMFK